jgi:hypothetical protein
MNDSEARIRQILDYAFGDLLGFLPSDFAIWMIFSAIGNCRGDDGVNLVWVGQCEAPRRRCFRSGTILRAGLERPDERRGQAPNSSRRRRTGR